MPPVANATRSLRRSDRPRRQTKQRALIWDVLAAANGDHLSVAEVEAAVRLPAPRFIVQPCIARSTGLVDDGLLTRTNLGHDGSHYEIAHHHRHHHLVCEHCGKVEHVRHQAVRSVFRGIEATSGFDLADATLSLHGRCCDCRRR